MHACTHACGIFANKLSLPGGCVACTSKSSSNFVPVSCLAGADVECCYDCAPGNLRVSANRCSPPCDIAYAYTNGATGSCALCKAGTIQNTTSGKECVRCSALKAYWPNYHATSYGCVACSALSVVNAEATGCDPCDSGMHIMTSLCSDIVVTNLCTFNKQGCTYPPGGRSASDVLQVRTVCPNLRVHDWERRQSILTILPSF